MIPYAVDIAQRHYGFVKQHSPGRDSMPDWDKLPETRRVALIQAARDLVDSLWPELEGHDSWRSLAQAHKHRVEHLKAELAVAQQSMETMHDSVVHDCCVTLQAIREKLEPMEKVPMTRHYPGQGRLLDEVPPKLVNLGGVNFEV